MSAVLNSGEAASQAIYFGKLPSRGDFVRSAAGAPLIHKLDAWMSQMIELMSEDTRWKLVYDAAAPVHFAVLGALQKLGLVGHLAPSQDSAGRRFPFMRAAVMNVDDPAGMLSYFPMAVMPMWRALQKDVHAVGQAETFSEALLSAVPVPAPSESAFLCENYLDASAIHTLDQLALWVLQSAPPPSEGFAPGAQPQAPAGFDVRQTLLALGMLLQPVRTQGPTGLSKGLILPLPLEPQRQASVMAFWTALIAPFFRGTHAELMFLVCTLKHGSQLLVGFHGLSPVSLRAALDTDFAAQENILVTDAGWVEEWIETDVGLRKLSTVLQDTSLSWSSATDLFHEVFLGA